MYVEFHSDEVRIYVEKGDGISYNITITDKMTNENNCLSLTVDQVGKIVGLLEALLQNHEH